MAETMTTLEIYFLMGVMLVTGSINTIANKLMQNTVSLGIKFEHHQKFITFSMFIGESVCLAIYYLTRKKTTRNKPGPIFPESSAEGLIKDAEGGEEKSIAESTESIKEPELESPKIWYFLFPAFMDLLASTTMSISLTYLATSIYQMFRGAVIIFTALAAFLFLKSRLHRHHVTGIAIVVLGLGLVGLNAVIQNDSKGTGSNPVAGIILVITAQTFAAIMFIIEEKLLKGYKTPALKAVGLEGMWGVICYVILLVVSYFIRCDDWSEQLKENLCQMNQEGEYRFEDAIFAFEQIFASLQLSLFMLLYICSIAFFNFAGLSVTKFVSSTARTIVDTLRTVVIWLFFLTMPFVPEETVETFYWLQLVGFIILIIGSALYNEIIVIPLCGFDYNTKANKKKREEEEESKLKEGENNNEEDKPKDDVLEPQNAAVPSTEENKE